MSGFETDPVKTHAVVVAVETYDIPGKNLDGPARDARRFVDWLLGCDVPTGQIKLFASPLPANAPLIDGLGIPYEPARREPIYKYLTQALPGRSGDLLFLSWGGHGILTEADERRLFYADATDADYLNLDLNSLLTSLRCRPYAGLPRQIAFIDACANYTVHLPGSDKFPIRDLDPSRDQFVLLGARSGEVAVNARKGGVFSAALLDDLEAQPKRPFPPDLEALADRLIATFIARRAAKDARQTPVYFWTRDWAGSYRRFGDHAPSSEAVAAVAATVPAPAPTSEHAWTLREKLDLGWRLIACRSVEDPNRRSIVFGEMRPEIKNNYTHSSVPIDDVFNMITTCLNYSGGIEELIEIIGYFEAGTIHFKAVEDWLSFHRVDL